MGGGRPGPRGGGGSPAEYGRVVEGGDLAEAKIVTNCVIPLLMSGKMSNFGAMKCNGTKYRSVWDWLTYGLVGAITAYMVVMYVLFPTWVMIAIGVPFIFAIVLMLRSVCYFVDGDELVVHVWPSTSRYPIRKIASVTRTTGLMASTATSATQRLAIRFTDRSVLKSAMPIYISPVRQDEFIRQLLEINPNIRVEG